jgi:hypothetical protein
MDEAGSIDLSEEFVEAMTDHFVEGFRRLDAIPREDPFWDGTNRRPTSNKMYSYCEKALRDNPDDIQALWIRVATQVVHGMAFSPSTWESLNSADRLDATWIVHAALYAEIQGGYDTVPELLKLLRKTGLHGRVLRHLKEMVLTMDGYIAKWARRVIEGRDSSPVSGAEPPTPRF